MTIIVIFSSLWQDFLTLLNPDRFDKKENYDPEVNHGIYSPGPHDQNKRPVLITEPYGGHGESSYIYKNKILVVLYAENQDQLNRPIKPNINGIDLIIPKDLNELKNLFV
ncbi:MAG: hypothetical protein WC621_05450 [Patescibacteria group bacterium]